MFARVRKSLDENEKGFTLIELLVVIIIIGILSAIAIPLFLNQRKKAVDASIKSDLRTVATEIETYYTDAQAYPTTVTATTAAAPAMTVTTGSPFNLTLGNIVSYKIIGTDKFCVYGENANGTGGAGKGFSYLSGSGGLQTGAAAAKPGVC